ncbi:MAG: hypothetical protein Q8N26_18300 [Myxococcales bacterium]|nr:hypothetical protein [Myxococcales bacterium]
MTRLVLAAVACAATMFISVSACSVMPSGPREICGNTIDDDNNGLIDCADPDCKGKSECSYDGGFFGTCGKCGSSCTNQVQCLTTGFFNDVPLPYCENPDGGSEKKCTAFQKNVQIDVILNAQQAWGTLIGPTRSIATRFIKRKAADGSPVTCATIEAAAPGRLAVNAKQLEDSGKFTYQGIDVRPITNASGSIPIRFLNVLTGADFLIWMEMWGGTPDSATKFPTGNRLGFECFDGPALGMQWAPITETDNCTTPGTDAGSMMTVCKQLQVQATRGPQP